MGRDSHRTASRRINRAVCEALENRVLLSNPIVLEPLPREQRDNYIAPTSYSPTLAAPPEHFEYEFTEPRLVYNFDQSVSGLDNQTHVLTGLYQVVAIENEPYPLVDVPLSVWTGPFATEFNTLLLDSADGLTWAGSEGDVSATLVTEEYSVQYWVWQHKLTVTTPTGSVVWRLNWNGHNSEGNVYRFSYTGDGNDSYLQDLGSPKYVNTQVAGNVIEDISQPISDGGTGFKFTFPTALPNGHYDAVLSSQGITNSSGQHLDGVPGFFDGDGDGLDDPGDYVYSFFVLAGDANHDRVINMDDFGVIDANVGQSGSVFGFFNGDFNYDGKINIEDYGIIDSAYATQLPAPLTGANEVSASAAYQRSDVDNFIRLQWSTPVGVTDVDSWRVWRSEDGGVTFTLLEDIIPAADRTWDDIGDGQGLPEGTKYTYRIRAYSNELGYAETTNKAWSVTNLPGPITATITDVTTTSMTLNWADNATNEHGYDIWREDELIASVPANSTSYTIRGLTPSTAYTFTVNAYTEATGSLPASAQAATLDGPVEPANLVATPLSDGHRVQLSWGNVENEAGFLIERSTEGGEWQAIATLAPDVTTYLDEGLNSLGIYEYRVTSLGENTSALGGEAFAYGTTSTGENNSPPSEEAFTLTDHGNGVVYSGPPSDDTEDYTFDDVTAQWSGPWNRTDGPVLNEAITLTLDNLPDHYGLEVHFFGSAINAGHTPTDSDTLTLSGLGDGSEYVMDHQELFLWDLHVTADHNGDSVTLTVEGSDFESGQVWWGQGYAEDSWGMEGVEVKLLRYRVGLSANTLTINNDNEEPVPVTVTKADGTPAAGVELSPEREDGVELTDSATTNSEGVALLSLKGVKLGLATLVLQAAGGARAAAQPSVKEWSILVNGGAGNMYPGPNSFETFGTGQQTIFAVTIFDADGQPIPALGPAPQASVRPGGATFNLNWAPDPYDPITWLLVVECLDSGLTAGWSMIDITYPLNPPTVAPETISVFTSVYTLSMVLPIPPVPHEMGTPDLLVVGVSGPWGPVEGVKVDARLRLESNELTVSGKLTASVDSQKSTNANGLASFELTSDGPFFSGNITTAFDVFFRIGNGGAQDSTVRYTSVMY